MLTRAFLLYIILVRVNFLFRIYIYLLSYLIIFYISKLINFEFCSWYFSIRSLLFFTYFYFLLLVIHICFVIIVQFRIDYEFSLLMHGNQFECETQTFDQLVFRLNNQPSCHVVYARVINFVNGLLCVVISKMMVVAGSKRSVPLSRRRQNSCSHPQSFCVLRDDPVSYLYRLVLNLI